MAPATSTPAHTPGPWHVKVNPVRHAVISPSGYVAESIRGMSGTEVLANARLIAAAPDGLVLARAVAAYFGDEPIEPFLDANIKLRDMARAIVAKAEGR